MEVQSDVYLGTDGLPDGGHPLLRRVPGGRGVDPPEFFGRRGLQGREPGFYLRLGVASEFRRRVPADVLVDADAVPGPAADEFVHGRAEVLAPDVPERLVDPGYRALQHGTPAVEPAGVHRLPVVRDAGGVLAQEVPLQQFLDRCLDGLRLALHDGFAPPHEAVAGLQPQEQPPRGDAVQVVVGDGRHTGWQVSPWE